MPIYFERFFRHINNQYYEIQKSIHDLNSIGIEITGRCNLQCRHCYMDSQKESEKEEMNCDDWIGFFDVLNKSFGNKILIRITGGEPLVRADIFIILEYLKKLGFRFSLASNGILLGQENLIELKEYLSTLSISLDGFKESHNYLRNADVFEQTVENIRNAKKIGIKDIEIKTTVYKKNLHELKGLFAFVKKLGVSQWHIYSMYAVGRGEVNKREILFPEEYQYLCKIVNEVNEENDKEMKFIFEEQSSLFLKHKMSENKKNKLCYAGISSCSILNNGDIVSCVQDRDFVYGNVKDCNFKEIWDNEFKRNRLKEYRFCQNNCFNK